MSSPPGPLTIPQFRYAYQSGLTPRDVLTTRWQALCRLGTGPTGDAALIATVSREHLERQLDRLEGMSPAESPLFGIPFVVKDNIDVEGLPTTAAFPGRTRPATRSAHVIHLLQQAGAIVLAKTNLDQFATGLVGTRSPFGSVPNPFSDDYVSGGSSSGSASIVARGFVPFALGTDTAGSGRVPAGFCNLVGLKPTPGLVSTQGVLPACASLDCVSVFTLTVVDAEALLPVIACAADRPMDEPRYHAPVPERLAFAPTMRFGIPYDLHFDDLDYESAFMDAIRRIEDQGHSVVRVDGAPLEQVGKLLYQGPWVAERYSVVGPLIEADAPGLDPTVVRVIRQAQGLTAVQTFDALYALRAAEAQLRSLWADIDVLMVPTAPGIPTRSALADDPVGRNAALGRYTNAVNLLGWSALALPASMTPRGLPFGICWIAPAGCDAALLHAARRWEEDLDLPLGAGLSPRSTVPLDAPLDLPATIAGEPVLPIAVVGAHLQGMPLHHQIVEAGARLLGRTRTAPHYRLHALAGGPPARPGLVRASASSAGTRAGASIELEVYAFPLHAVGPFLARIAPPLGLGSVELEDGRWVKGFICEPCGLDDSTDITASGGWRYHLGLAAPGG